MSKQAVAQPQAGGRARSKAGGEEWKRGKREGQYMRLRVTQEEEEGSFLPAPAPALSL